MTKEKIITIENVDFGTVANSIVFTVPVGQSFSISRINLIKNEVATAVQGDGNFRLARKSDDAEIYADTSAIIPNAGTSKQITLEASPVINSGDKIELQVTDADTGDEAICTIEIVGLISGDIITEAGKQYSDIEAVRSYTGKPLTTEAEIEEVEKYIGAMTRIIDSLCNRIVFDDEISTYTYDGDGSDLLVIKDVCDITEVTIGGVATEFVKYPQNKPYASRLKLDGYRFTKGLANVAVTGIQAMNSTLPEDVKLACTVLVAGVLNNKDIQGKVGTTERIGAYSVTYRDEAQQADFATAKATLSAYKRIAL
jgi:hypothetical protein